MGTEIATAPDHGQVDQAMEWLMRLPKLQPQDLPAMQEIEATVAALSEPANPAWIMARIAALLNPYYDKDTPAAVRRMEAEDWLEALAVYPQWAIERAVRWWKSEANADRRKRPLEGDIAARCKVEMRGISAIPKIVSFGSMRQTSEREREPWAYKTDPERAKQVVAELGIFRFGGDDD